MEKLKRKKLDFLDKIPDSMRTDEENRVFPIKRNLIFSLFNFHKDK